MQLIIILINGGNLGTGVAVAGAFGLVRFRSAPGTAREIGALFLATALGLVTGMGAPLHTLPPRRRCPKPFWMPSAAATAT